MASRHYQCHSHIPCQSLLLSGPLCFISYPAPLLIEPQKRRQPAPIGLFCLPHLWPEYIYTVGNSQHHLFQSFTAIFLKKRKRGWGDGGGKSRKSSSPCAWKQHEGKGMWVKACVTCESHTVFRQLIFLCSSCWAQSKSPSVSPQ